MVSHVPVQGSMENSLQFIYYSHILETSKPGAFDVNIIELSAYVWKQTYG